jgi:hypothetical protein
MPTEQYDKRLAVVRSIALQETKYGNTEKIVRVIAEVLGEHSEPRVAPVSAVVVLSAEEGWISWPLSPT